MAYPEINPTGTMVASSGGAPFNLTEHDATARGGNAVILRSSAHTLTAPRLAMFYRNVPQVDPSRTGVARAGLKIVFGDVDANGDPRPQNSIVELSVRNPLLNDDDHVLNALKWAYELLFYQTDVWNPLVTKGALPRV